MKDFLDNVFDLTSNISNKWPNIEQVGAGKTVCLLFWEPSTRTKLSFELAQNRTGRLVSVHKSNVLESSQFWQDIVHEVHKDYLDIELSDMYVDNAAMQIIQNPKQFDVIVTQNLFGDILSDISAMITGSLGMLPSASIGEKHSLYEPVHGSAPDLAGRNIANPIAAILSIAMMLGITFKEEKICSDIYKAVNETLED